MARGEKSKHVESTGLLRGRGGCYFFHFLSFSFFYREIKRWKMGFCFFCKEEKRGRERRRKKIGFHRFSGRKIWTVRYDILGDGLRTGGIWRREEVGGED